MFKNGIVKKTCFVFVFVLLCGLLAPAQLTVAQSVIVADAHERAIAQGENVRPNGGNFAAPVSYNVGTQPSPPASNVSADGVATGDFRGQGTLDLAVVHTVDHTLNILLNNGDGTFQPAVRSTPGGGTVNPEVITAGNLRNKGITDLIVCDYDHNINVFLGNGDGTFQPAVGYDTGEYPRAVAIADVNGDGTMDLVVGNVGNITEVPPAAGSVAVLLGNGDGTFQDPIQYTPFNYPGWLTVGDFDGDGLPDIAVTRVQDGHSVNVMLNQP